MAHLTYEESKKKVFFGLGLLAVVTLIEVIVSLAAKGHIIPGLEKYAFLFYTAGIVIVILSLYKAYFIVYEFMHMRYEAKGLAMSVLLPTILLIWAIIAFFQEGNSWKSRRNQIKQKNEQAAPSQNMEGSLQGEDIYRLG